MDSEQKWLVLCWSTSIMLEKMMDKLEYFDGSPRGATSIASNLLGLPYYYLLDSNIQIMQHFPCYKSTLFSTLQRYHSPPKGFALNNPLQLRSITQTLPNQLHTRNILRLPHHNGRLKRNLFILNNPILPPFSHIIQ